MAKRAVIWLSGVLDKAILRLDRGDFFRHHLGSLVLAFGSADELCQQVFEDLRGRIAYRERLPAGQKVILFSPHPDDDVISAGGILDKLVQNKNDLTVAYMTNGSVAVFDEDVRRHLMFAGMSLDALGVPQTARAAVAERRSEIETFLASKAPGQTDTPQVQEIKARIRYSEAVAGIEVMGLTEANARFLDMPFYQTGTVRKNPVGEADVEVVLALLREIQPDHVLVAGDLSDPHGTHQMCYVAIRDALARYNGGVPELVEAPTRGRKKKAAETTDDGAADDGASTGDGAASDAAPAAHVQPLIWLYRGAWQEWEIHRSDMFLPMSRADLDRKIMAIHKHESQKDRAMFPGAYDEREFWQRARDRNTGTADALNRLGLPEFYAAEAYVTTYDMD